MSVIIEAPTADASKTEYDRPPSPTQMTEAEGAMVYVSMITTIISGSHPIYPHIVPPQRTVILTTPYSKPPQQPAARLDTIGLGDTELDQDCRPKGFAMGPV